MSNNSEELDDIKALSKQLNYELKEMEQKIMLLKNSSVDLSKSVKEMDTIALLLNTLPQKVGEKIGETISNIAPQVAKEIQQDLTKELKDSIQKCYDVIVMVTNKADDLFKRNIIRYFQGLALAVILSVTCCMGASYLIMKNFPQRIFMDSKGATNIEKSSVHFWGKPSVNLKPDNNKIQKNKD